MHQLISIDSNMKMTSMEIAELVESRHDNVKTSIERLSKQGVIELPALQEIPTSTKPMKVYVFTGEQGKRDSIIVVAQLSPGFTARLVDRWQELEKQLESRFPVTLEMQMARGLLAAQSLLAEKQIQIEQRDKLISDIKPKADALEKISIAYGEMCLSNAGKVLGWQKLKDFFVWLHSINWTFRRGGDWVAHQDKLRSGLMVAKVVKYESTDGTQQVKEQALVTPKGLAKLAEIMERNGLQSA